jgi:hypothetical protein
MSDNNNVVEKKPIPETPNNNKGGSRSVQIFTIFLIIVTIIFIIYCIYQIYELSTAANVAASEAETLTDKVEGFFSSL